jgi:hypothetical protein
MRIAIESFRGEAPRMTPRALPENAAQSAINSRLQTGDLETWRQFALTEQLANNGDVETIYLLNDRWLSWTADVDVARGAIPGDNTFRTYLTGPDVYDQPRFTNYALATTGSEPLPVTTRPLGVPSPDTQPTAVAGVSTLGGPTITDILDNGDQLATSWSTSSPVSTAFTRSIVSQTTLSGDSVYSLEADENNDFPAFLFRDFGISDSQVVEASWDVIFNTASRKRMLAHVKCNVDGAGAAVYWSEAGGFQILLTSAFNLHGVSVLAGIAVGAPAPDIRYTVTCQIAKNTAGSFTITATLYSGSAQLATLTVTNALTNSGGFVGFTNQVAEPTAPDPVTYYDNIHVRATSPTTAVEQIATSYVYTFVNDLGEESAPSPPSATILKDDGTAITVTTATTVPSGFSVDYSIETKRIYRAASGATGTVFEFVAEIPLSQADYVDELTDSELGDPLETELYALPPDDLRGLIALPNGVMAGFRRNQLCFSAQNRPHAWPVEWRLNTDTDIVCIGNIDTTVVVGTKAFPYLAIGNDPSAYSMTKLEVQQAAVSKRSVAYLVGIGVVFASPDGLIAVAGNGKVSNLTETIFTRRQWQNLIPETILAIAHDDVYHFFSGGIGASALTSADYKSYALDMKQTGFGLIELGYHAIAVHANPLTDRLYLVLDALDEPFDAYLPVSSTAPVIREQTANSNIQLLVAFDEASDPFKDSSQNAFVPVVVGSWTQGAGVINSNNASSSAWSITYGANSPALIYDNTVGFTVEARATCNTNPGLGGDGLYAAFYDFGTSADLRLELTPPGLGTDWQWRVTLQGSPTFYGPHFAFHTFSHIAVVVPPGVNPTARIYIDGALITTVALTSPSADPTNAPFSVQRQSQPVATGLSVDYARLTRGEVYTADFTPPTDSDIVPTGHNVIYEFDAESGDGDLVQRYKGKLNLLPDPRAFLYCQVKAEDYDNLLMNLYADGVLFLSEVITSQEPFTLPLDDSYQSFEFEFVGTSRVRTAQFVEDIRELV